MLKLAYILYIITICYINCHRRITHLQHQNDKISAIPVYNTTTMNVDNKNILTRKLLSSADHKVTSLPGLVEDLNHYSGHISIDSVKGSNIFYWLFESPTNSEKLPLLIWLNGGPGCSSMDGLWLELGPLRLDTSTRKVKINPFSWHNVANLLFIDQPVGTGFSYTKNNKAYPTNDLMINQQFYKFLIAFFNLHQNYISTDGSSKFTRDLYISGESHAGHYIPSMAMHIMKLNENIDTSSTDRLEIRLKGIALGNPWIDPYSQYDASDYAHGKGIITQGQKNKLKEAEKICQTNLRNGKLNTAICFSLLDKVVDSSSISGNLKVLMYDSRKYVTHTGVFPPGHNAVENYLNKPEVKASIHSSTTPHKFQECTDPPYFALSHQDGKGVLNELQMILDNGLRVLVFAGQYDIICNHLGIEKAVNRINWKYRTEWLKAQPGVWLQNKKPAGYIRAFKNLEYLLVLDAGHMVPMDQPQVSLAMIQNFIGGKSFISGLTKIGTKELSSSSSSSTSSDCICPITDNSIITTVDNNSSRFILRNHNRNPVRKKIKPSLLNSFLPHSTNIKRQLSDEDETFNFPYYLSITNIIPMESSVILHLHLKYIGSELHESFKKASSNVHFDIRIEPGNRVVDVNMDLFENYKYNADMVIDGLNEKGIDYSFSVWIVENQSKRSYLISKQSITARVGCYNPKITQCCGRGICVNSAAINTDSNFSQQTRCICDYSYSGEYCDYYQVEDPVKGISVNVSAADTICPASAISQGGTSLKVSSTSPKDRIHHSSSEVHNYCQHSIIDNKGDKSISKCCVSIEFLLYSKHINSWISGKRFETLYQMHLSELIKYDIMRALELDNENLNLHKNISVFPRVGPTLSNVDDRVIFNQTFSKSGIRLDHLASQINEVNEYMILKSPHHHHHHHYITILLCGESKMINLATEELLHQRKNQHSSLLGGIVTSHIKPGYIIIINHKYIQDSRILSNAVYTYDDKQIFSRLFHESYRVILISISFVFISLFIVISYFCIMGRYTYINTIKVQ